MAARNVILKRVVPSILCLGMALGADARVLINEIMAVNASGLRNEYGQTSDWIELYNASDQYIDLAGYLLTDEPSKPSKWQFPLDKPSLTRIKPRGFLIVWADNATGTSALHANFSLSSEGEQIALFDPAGSLLDIVEFGPQTADCSFGRSPDGAEGLQYLLAPTPGLANSKAYLGLVSEPLFSRHRGLYDSPISIELICLTDGASIWYTTDGTDPLNSRTAKVYSGPLSIAKTTPIRAAAKLLGWKPSKVVTNTYIIGASAAVRSLPIISLVGDPGQTFYEPNGVAAIVGGTYVNGVWQSTGPDSYNNILNRDLERPVSFEWIEPNGNSIQADCGLRVHGSNYMRPRYRQDSKFSWRLYFRGEYGPDLLDYPLFPFEVHQFDTIVIRAGHNDMTNPFIKDELVRRLLKDMGHVSSGGTFANLFINGQYKGYYNPCEHIDEHFCQAWYDSNKPWDVVTMSGDAREGNRTRWDALIQLVRQSNLADDQYYQQVLRQLDVEQFIDYLILRLWSGDWDWPQNNWSAASEVSEEGKWRFFVWDAEGAFFPDRLQAVRFGELNSQNNEHGYLYRALKANADFRRLFADRLQQHMLRSAGALSGPHIQQMFERLRAQMLGVIPKMDTYLIQTWVPQRPAIFLAACKAEGLYNHPGPVFFVNGSAKDGGYAKPGDVLTISSPEPGATIYYSLDGTDPATGWPPGGLGLTKLIDRASTKRYVIPLAPMDSTWLLPDGFDDSGWQVCSGQPGGIGFGRSGDFPMHISCNIQRQMDNINTSCLVRIGFNCPVGPEGISALALTVQYDAGFVAYINGVEVARRNFPQGLEPAWDSNAIAESLDSEAIIFRRMDITDMKHALRAGKNLLAIHAMNSSIADKDFLINAELIADITLLPIAPGVSLYTGPIVLDRTTSILARSLKDRGISGLSKAIFAIGPISSSIRVTELMYHPSDGQTEYVELTNIGTAPIDLAYVRLAGAVEFSFPSVRLGPGEYLVVAKDPGSIRSMLPGDAVVLGPYCGSLDNKGETVALLDPLGATILTFTYQDWWYPIANGRGYSLTLVDPTTDPNAISTKMAWRPSAWCGGSPGGSDSQDAIPPGSVIINEIMANPPTGQEDWVELHNTTDRPIDIGGWALSDDRDELDKYKIPPGTVIDPCGYLVLHADRSFGTAFGLSNTGEEVWLTAGSDGLGPGYCDYAVFGPSEQGVALGRYEDHNAPAALLPMERPTPGQANAMFLAGPVLITEVLARPDQVPDAHFIELYNAADGPVSLYDQSCNQAWALCMDLDGRQTVLPLPTDLTLRPGGCLLIARSRRLLEMRFQVNPRVHIMEWAGLALDRVKGPIRLVKPSIVSKDKPIQWIEVDVGLIDRSMSGRSLQRIDNGPGMDRANWQYASPSPGLHPG